jgi:predicted MFS family arabinose efflux permease
VSSPITSARRRAILTVAIGAIAMDSALLGVVAPLLPEIERRTGATEAALGAALAAYALPIVVASVPFGRLADRLGRRPLLLAGLPLTAAGSLMIAGTESLELLVAGRAVQGIGSAASWIAALAMVSDLAPSGRRGEAIGFALAANGAGSIAGPAVGGVAGDAISFAAPFLITSGICIALAVAAALVLPSDQRAEPSAASPWGVIAASTRSGIGAVAAAITIGAATVLGLVEVVAPLDLDERLGLSSAVIGLLFAGSIAIDAITVPFGGRWGDRRGRGGVASLGLALLAISVGMLALVDGTVGAGLALGVFGAGSALAFAAAVPWLDHAFGEVDRGLAYGSLNVLFATGYLVGPLIGGALLDLGGADLSYWLTAAALAGGTFATWAVARQTQAACG